MAQTRSGSPGLQSQHPFRAKMTLISAATGLSTALPEGLIFIINPLSSRAFNFSSILAVQNWTVCQIIDNKQNRFSKILFCCQQLFGWQLFDHLKVQKRLQDFQIFFTEEHRKFHLFSSILKFILFRFLSLDFVTVFSLIKCVFPSAKKHFFSEILEPVVLLTGIWPSESTTKQYFDYILERR